MTLDLISQLMIGITGILGIYLVGSKEARWRMWAGYAGLAGEPFWFITAYQNEQWGIILLVFVYTYGWWRVVVNNRTSR